jgi:cyclopropane fatty-acyl-phospholipid synthase-like methyltransferase
MDSKQHNTTVYNQHAKAYLHKFLDFDLYHNTYDSLLSMLPLNATVLELGCGPGNVVRYFLQKRPDLQITGIDLAPEMIRQAEKTNPNATFQILDIRDAGAIQEKFDAVAGTFCLPYLSYEDLDLFFGNLKSLTKENGIIYISCMEGPPERSGFEKTSFTGDDELYITYYERGAIEARLAENGFLTEAFFTKAYPETDGSVTTDLIYIARKGVAF